MGYISHTLRVMIASPSDLVNERDAVERAIHDWNTSNSVHKRVVLLPWRWESSSVPEIGDSAQSLINQQGVDDSDIVIALFGSRLGSPTMKFLSGTAEEIERAASSGKPVHIYFSSAPLPNNADLQQVQALRDFRAELQSKSLLGEFSSETELLQLVWRAIEHDLANLNLTNPLSETVKSGVDFLVQPQQDKEQTGIDQRGKVKYRTRSWVEVTNRGQIDAESVRFQVVPENSGYWLVAPESAVTVHAGQMRKMTTEASIGGSRDPQLRITWVENGEEKEKLYQL